MCDRKKNENFDGRRRREGGGGSKKTIAFFFSSWEPTQKVYNYNYRKPSTS